MERKTDLLISCKSPDSKLLFQSKSLEALEIVSNKHKFYAIH